jgi:dTDP-4-amino-4,6-dideoxygalactose transaminase
MNKFRIIPRFAPSLSSDSFRFIFKKIDKINLIEEFEEKFASYINRKYAIFTPSGRFAFHLILNRLISQDKRKKIILPSFTHPSIPLIALNLGLKPVFFDVRKNIPLLEINKSQGYNDCLAVVATHLFGFSVDMEEVMEFASRNGLFIIEDCAQGLGAKYKNKFLGSFGYASFYSFSLTKNFTTLSGGMLVTDDFGLKSELKKIITKDKKVFLEILKAFLFLLFTNPVVFSFFVYPFLLASKNDLIEIIFKEKILPQKVFKDKIPLSLLKAKLGLLQLNSVEGINKKRNENGQYLLTLLKKMDLGKYLILPQPIEYSQPIYLSFPILVRNRIRLKRYLLKKGIDSTIGFLKACHLLNLFKNFKAYCPNAEFVEKNILHLPIHHKVARSDLNYIAQTFKKYFQRYEG